LQELGLVGVNTAFAGRIRGGNGGAIGVRHSDIECRQFGITADRAIDPGSCTAAVEAGAEILARGCNSAWGREAAARGREKGTWRAHALWSGGSTGGKALGWGQCSRRGGDRRRVSDRCCFG
jgi:hypothetical protein